MAYRATARSLYSLLICSVLLFTLSSAKAQNLGIGGVGNDISTPVPGAGHDYTHLLAETVNPANGTVSLRISLPVPKARGFTLPFSIAYDSDYIYFYPTGLSPFGAREAAICLREGGAIPCQWPPISRARLVLTICLTARTRTIAISIPPIRSWIHRAAFTHCTSMPLMSFRLGL